MRSCRICGAALSAPIYEAPAPAITSLTTILNVPTTIWLCDVCEHAQSPDIPDVQKFYDTEYQISAASEEHDQLYEMVNGRAVYRTDRQAEVVLELLQLRQGARVLDFGCAKAATLRKVLAKRPDIMPYVFDVSDSYETFWRAWLAPDRCATHVLPGAWRGQFDAVTAHYMLEHVVDPVGVVASVHTLLNDGGQLFLSVPDPITNPGDLLVVDHLNHFTPASLVETMVRAGFAVERLERRALQAALVVIARRVGDATYVDTPKYESEIRKIGRFWRDASERLRAFAVANPSLPCAIYGAGFYGTWVASVVRNHVHLVGFIDNNQHLQNDTHFALPVMAPTALPNDVKTIFVGLNPLRARQILAESTAPDGRELQFVYLDVPTA